jgi:opacity protein-like surface antigen
MVLTFLFLVGISQAQDFIKGFSVKLTGGYGTMAVGDFNTVMEGYDTLLNDIASILGLTREGELKEINWGFEYEGEFIMNLTENFGIGIGAGYIRRKEKSESSVKAAPFFNLTFSGEPEITAIPIKLSAHYFFPVTSQVNVFLNGGIGYYFGKINYHLRSDIQVLDEPEESGKIEGEVKDNALGFHGGIGVEYNVAKNIAFFVEGAGRYAKLKDWEGDETQTLDSQIAEQKSGTLWYYEGLVSDFGTEKYYSSFELQEGKLTWPDIRNVRKAEGDLSGFSLRAGIRIKF